MTTIQLSGAWSVDARRTLRFAVGAITGGTLNDGGTVHEVDSGGLVSAGFQSLALRGRSLTPTVDLSVDLGVAWAETRTGDGADYSATDLRFGARAAWSVADAVVPYAALRLFGGPVRWSPHGEVETGGDAHHYQLATGVAAAIGPLTVSGEWAGAGEQGWSLGVSAGW